MFGVSLLMNKSKFNDYVFASGKSTSVRELLTISASVAGFDPKFEGSGLNEVCFDLKTGTKLALSDQKFYRNVDPNLYVGDTTKLTTETGWNPTRNFTEVIEKMTKVDILRVLK
jgi:GDPmannose 4,6-dehydratase